MALPARILILSAALICAGMAWAAPRRPLDRVRIHALYHDGEFERILRELEAYGKGECACVKDDSVFAEKHLAVVLAAAPATRELGRYHMFRLLDLSPRADLLDMYVGDEVDAVFEKVRKEHDLRVTDAMGKAPAAPTAVLTAPRAIALRRAPASLPATPVAPATAPALRAATVAVALNPPSAQGSQPAYSDAWARASEAGSRPAIRARVAARPASRFIAPAAKKYTPWDAPVADPTARMSRVVSAPASASEFGSATATAQPSSEVAAASEPDTSRPAWKKPGIWIGGGAAIAAIAFTLWHSGSESGGPGKTYAVPASLSKSP